MQTPVQDRLAVLLFTDIVNSVDLQSRLGTRDYSELLDHHDQIYRSVIDLIPSSKAYQDTGDGHLTLFGTAEDAVTAALLFQERLDSAKWTSEKPTIRVGLHQGQVTEIIQETAGTPKVVGMPINIASRIMDLGGSGQILMTRMVFDDARQFVKHHPSLDSELEWKAHGRYLLKGHEEPMEVFQVGVSGNSNFTVPEGSSKATRAVTLDEESTLGWRPAVGLQIPHRNGWILREQMGKGGFGEVWLAHHTKLNERRVYKFCFDARRQRSLKREVTLLRLIRETLGKRNDIALIYDIQLDETPYFIELDYVEDGDLNQWAEKQGGLSNVSLAQRIKIVASIAEALAASHSVGVIHKDIKPSNILISRKPDGDVQPQLIDFGIGLLSDKDKLAKHGITEAGFTESNTESGVRQGTRMYSPPETLAGHPFTTKGDIFSLGVLLYQMVSGDTKKPLAVGWEDDIEDELLRQDIKECVAGDPTHRLSGASEIRQRLEDLQKRRAILERAQKTKAKKQFRRKLLAATTVFSALLLLIAVVFHHRGQVAG